MRAQLRHASCSAWWLTLVVCCFSLLERGVGLGCSSPLRCAMILQSNPGLLLRDLLMLQVATDACCLLTLDLNTMTQAEAAFEVSISSSGQSAMPCVHQLAWDLHRRMYGCGGIWSPGNVGRLQ